MHTHLPTCTFGTWTVASLRDSLITELETDKASSVLRLYFYAITSRGWDELRKSVKQWVRARKGNSVLAYVGTDHAITEPAALSNMCNDGVTVRIMERYQGVFHPKVVWIEGAGKHAVWVGSNNLTRDGLLNNIEFAVVVKSKKIPSELQKWSEAVHAGSTELTSELLRSYETERQRFEQKKARSKTTTFTWGRKREPENTPIPKIAKGDLIVEVMPKETGLDGTQLQLPVAAAEVFFGIKGVGTTKSVKLQSVKSKNVRRLTITVFRNNTVRISINELEYRDRPCVIVFHKWSFGIFKYEIVAQSIFPTRYKMLLRRCIKQTRRGSRRWVII